MKLPTVIVFLLFFSSIVSISTTQPANIKLLRQRFTNDIQRLNNKLLQSINNNNTKEHPAIKIQLQSTQSISPQLIDKIQSINLQQENILISSNQLVQFSLQNMPDLNIIDVKITQQSHNPTNSGLNKQQQHSSSRQQKQQQQSSQFSNNNNIDCKFIDPQLTLSVESRIYTSFYPSLQTPGITKPQYIIFKTQQNKQRLLVVDNSKIFLYELIVDLDNKYVTRSNIIQLNTQYLRYLFDQQQNVFKSFDVGLFLLQEGNKKILFYQSQLYEVRVDNDFIALKVYGEIISKNEQNEQNEEGYQQKKQQSKQESQQLTKQIEKIIPLKFGFLVQYEKSIQIYLQQQEEKLNQQTNHKSFTPRLSQQQLKSLTLNKTIQQVHVQHNPSQNSGYKILILLESNHLIQLQYGAYTNIFVYNIPYGQRFIDLAYSTTSQKDIVQIIFELNRAKMTRNYIVQIFIHRQQNPSKPTVFVNRFYDDMTNIRSVQFVNNQLLLIGQYDTMLLDYPVNSQILIKQKIEPHPYHFAADGLLVMQMLYQSENQSAVLLIESTDMSIVKMTRKRQFIQCQPQDSINANIEILAYCPPIAGSTKKHQSTSICKYTTTLNITVSDQESLTLEEYKRYLIITLIIVLIILTIVIIRQLIKNKNIINQLKKIKESIINKKQKQMNQKGEKVHGSQKFSQLQQQVQSEGK